MKLTIPSIQNLKKREAFLFAHPDYYPEARLKKELSRIAAIRREKNLNWGKPTHNLQIETPKEFVQIPVKPTLIDKVKSIFTKG